MPFFFGGHRKSDTSDKPSLPTNSERQRPSVFTIEGYRIYYKIPVSAKKKFLKDSALVYLL